MPEKNAADRRNARTKIVIFVLLAIALPLLWRFTPLRDWVNLGTIFEWQKSLRNQPAAPLFVVATYLLGSLVFFPITILTIATVFAFGPFWGNLYALIGWLLAATQGYFLGRLIGHDSLHRLNGKKLSAIIDRAEQHGFLTVLALRIVPAGPFTLVNMFVGASDIRFRDFFWASVVGRIPGVVVMTLFGVQIENALRKPELVNIGILVIILVALPCLLSRLLRSFFHSRRSLI